GHGIVMEIRAGVCGLDQRRRIERAVAKAAVGSSGRSAKAPVGWVGLPGKASWPVGLILDSDIKVRVRAIGDARAGSAVAEATFADARVVEDVSASGRHFRYELDSARPS